MVGFHLTMPATIITMTGLLNHKKENQMTLETIIFDFGGVLLRTHDHAWRTKWDDRLGLKHGSFERSRPCPTSSDIQDR